MKIKIGDKYIGADEPVFIIAEIGINHNGDMELAKKLIDISALAGCDAVKFQKRTPELCVPEEQKNVYRDTPWGRMTYLDYRKRVEFWEEEYNEIDAYCKERGIIWFASPWDSPSIDFLENYDTPVYKVPSALATDSAYLKKLAQTGKPIIISTGATTLDIARKAVGILGEGNTIVMHCNSTYPAKNKEINLKVMDTYKKIFKSPIGYSGHEVGLQITLAAVALGAKVVERHITLDRSMWGSDQAASVEPTGLIRLVRDIRIIEQALGDGEKRIYDGELAVMKKLRRVWDIK